VNRYHAFAINSNGKQVLARFANNDARLAVLGQLVVYVKPGPIPNLDGIAFCELGFASPEHHIFISFALFLYVLSHKIKRLSTTILVFIVRM
jgi:hypothetical protein